MVDRLTSCKNQVRVLTQINEELDDEVHKSLQKNTAQGVRISTHEVSIGQQAIQIKGLEKQLKEMEGFAQEGWDLAETYTLEIKALKLEVMNLKTEPSNTNTTHTFRVVETRFYAQDYSFIVEAETEDEAIDLVANGYITEDSSGSLYGVNDSEYNEVSQLD
jgi:hypothetical protein